MESSFGSFEATGFGPNMFAFFASFSAAIFCFRSSAAFFRSSRLSLPVARGKILRYAVGHAKCHKAAERLFPIRFTTDDRFPNTARERFEVGKMQAGITTRLLEDGLERSANDIRRRNAGGACVKLPFELFVVRGVRKLVGASPLWIH